MTQKRINEVLCGAINHRMAVPAMLKAVNLFHVVSLDRHSVEEMRAALAEMGEPHEVAFGIEKLEEKISESLRVWSLVARVIAIQAKAQGAPK